MVGELGYGMWGMSSWTGSSDAESRESLQRAVDLGCNFFDSAWHYGSGHSEELLGELVRQNSYKKLYVATKIPPKNLVWPARPEFTLDDCYPPSHIEKYLHISLQNLGYATCEVCHYALSILKAQLVLLLFPRQRVQSFWISDSSQNNSLFFVFYNVRNSSEKLARRCTNHWCLAGGHTQEFQSDQKQLAK